MVYIWKDPSQTIPIRELRMEKFRFSQKYDNRRCLFKDEGLKIRIIGKWQDKHGIPLDYSQRSSQRGFHKKFIY